MEHLKEIIIDYLCMPQTDYALMINGKWGCGKTYYFKNEIIKNNEIEISDKTKYKVVYVSLNGVSEIEEINKLIIAEIFSKKKGYKVGSAIFNTALKLFKIEDVKGGFDMNDFFDLSSTILCFDDLERISTKLKIEDVFGHISSNFVEHRNIKTIFIAYEKELKERSEGVEYYHRIKEKLIGRVINFDLKIDETINGIIEQFSETNSDFYAFIVHHKDFFIQIIKKFKQENLRTILFCLNILERVFEKAIRGKEDLDEIIKQVILFVTIISFEFKGGRLKSSEYEDYKGLDLIDRDFERIKVSEITDVPLEKIENKEGALEIDENPSYAQLFYEKYLKRNFIDNYIFFKSIYKFILTGFVEDQFINEEFISIQKFIREQEATRTKPDEEITWDYIKDFRLLKDKSFQSNVVKFIKYIEEGKYDLYLYPNFLGFIDYFNKNKLIKITEKEIDDIFEKGIMRAKKKAVPKEDEITRYKLFGASTERIKQFQERIMKVHSEIKEEEFHNESKNLIIGLLGSAPKINSFFKEFRLIPIFHTIEIKELFEAILKTENSKLSEFYDSMYDRYNSSNIGDFLSEDNSNLIKLKDEFDKYIKENKPEGIKGYHFKEILDLLNNITKKLSNKENRELDK